MAVVEWKKLLTSIKDYSAEKLEQAPGIVYDNVLNDNTTKQIESTFESLVSGFDKGGAEVVDLSKELDPSKITENFNKSWADKKKIFDSYREHYNRELEKLKEQYDDAGDWFMQEVWDDWKESFSNTGKKLLSALNPFGEDLFSINNRWKLQRVVMLRKMNYDKYNKNVSKEIKIRNLKAEDYLTKYNFGLKWKNAELEAYNKDSIPSKYAGIKGVINVQYEMFYLYQFAQSQESYTSRKLLHGQEKNGEDNYLTFIKSLTMQNRALYQNFKKVEDGKTEYVAYRDVSNGKVFDDTFGTVIRNKSVESIQLSGADFLSNLFSAVFYFYEDESGEAKDLFSSPYKSHSSKYNDNEKSLDKRTNTLLSKEGFGVRLGKIEVPLAKNDSFEVSIGEQTIKKVKSTKTMSKSASFSFRLDNNLEWLDFFNKASGVNNSLKTSQKQVNELAPFTGLNTNWRKDISYIARSYSSSSSKSNITGKKLCLIVAYHDHLDPTYVIKGSVLPSTEDLKRSVKWSYFFEDVKISGIGDAITYNADSSGPTDITVNFIFKRLRKVTGIDNKGITLL